MLESGFLTPAALRYAVAEEPRAPCDVSTEKKVCGMLRWVLAFLVLAAAAGVLGFVLLAGVVAGVAKLLFLVFLGLVAISLAMCATHTDSEEF
jgi:uncharacterized membrane protein YtjA (UPF0391 family)